MDRKLKIVNPPTPGSTLQFSRLLISNAFSVAPHNPAFPLTAETANAAENGKLPLLAIKLHLPYHYFKKIFPLFSKKVHLLMPQFSWKKLF